jgi:hypothetical protein
VGTLLLLLAILGCGSDDPVLTAVAPHAAPPSGEASSAPKDEAPAVKAVRERREAREKRASRAGMDADYQKPKGVYVDALYFGGRDWGNARDEALRQFGSLTVEESLPDGARLYTHERGTIRVAEGRIQALDIPLPEPLRRSEALAVLNIPQVVDAYRPYVLEFRLLNVHGFRRIQLARAARDSEDIVRVHAWKFLNRER